MSCPYMNDQAIAGRIRAMMAGASQEQRAAALPYASTAAKAASPRDRALSVVLWLRALGQNPRDWTARNG